MATMLEVTCGSCGVVSKQTDGPLMTALGFRCSTCGEGRWVGFDEIDVVPGAVPFEEVRAAALAAAGTCECSGHFTVDSPIRCPECRGTDVVTKVIGHAD